MTTYGGYQKTSYGGGDEAGGFVYGGGSQQGSQGGAKGYNEESLRPVTIKQVLDCEEAYPGADFKLDGADIKQVTFVGQIRAIAPQPTHIAYRLDDGTGVVEVKKWVDTDQPTADADAGLAIDQYVRVWGRLKSFNNKKHVAAHVIRPVRNIDEVNYHLLEAAAVHLYFTRGPIGQQQGGTNAPGGGDSMFVDSGYGVAGGGNAGGGGTSHKLSNVSTLAQRMFDFLAHAPGGNEGVPLNVIASGSGLSTRDVLHAADELLGQGIIYTTVDDETWAILEY